MSQPAIVRAVDVKPVEMLPGAWRRTLATGERQMICQFKLAQGAVVPAHSHPHEQVGYVLEGRIRLIIDGQAYDLESGDSYFIPGGVEHEATALTDCMVLDVFSPPREEYRVLEEG